MCPTTMLSGTGPLSYHCDVYSFGVLLQEVLSGARVSWGKPLPPLRCDHTLNPEAALQVAGYALTCPCEQPQMDLAGSPYGLSHPGCCLLCTDRPSDNAKDMEQHAHVPRNLFNIYHLACAHVWYVQSTVWTQAAQGSARLPAGRRGLVCALRACGPPAPALCCGGRGGA